jgi:hypothetical protein
MLMRSRFYFLTFVLVLCGWFLCGAVALAALADPNPDFVDPPQPEAPTTNDPEALKNSIDIAPAPPAPPLTDRLEYFHKYRRGLSALAGPVIDTKRIQNKESALMRGSIRYLFKDRNLKTYEAGADLDSDGTGAILLTRRWIYSQTKFRPYEKLGLGIRIDPDDQLGTFLRYQHYQLRAGAGFEVLIADPASFRLELEGSASFHSLQAALTAGLVWAW